MTDGSGGWTSPSGGREDDPPRYGERVPGRPPAAAAVPAPTTYRPPPRPGLVPLHPLSFGQLLGASFGVIRWNPRAAVVPAVVVAVLQTVLLLGGFAAFGLSAIDRVQHAATRDDQFQILAGSIGGGVLYGLVVLVVAVVASALLQGMLVTVVARAAEGERIGIGPALRAAWRRALPLIAVALLLGLLQAVALAVLVLIVVLCAQAGDSGVWFAIAAAVLGTAAYAAAYVFVAVKLVTVPSAVVLEGLGPFAAMRRSWVLMRGAFWRSLGLVALVVVIVGFAAQLVTLPFSVIGGAVGGLLAPNSGGDLSTDSLLPLFVSTLPATIVGVIVQGIGQVAQVAALALVYLDLRMRREGLDLELQRYVEGSGRDPFERIR